MNTHRTSFGLRDGKFVVEDAARGYRQVRPLVRNRKDGSIMVLVPGGEFEMGDGQDENCPKHRVWVDAYYIGVYCVTNRQYARFVREGKGRAPAAHYGAPKWCAEELFDHPVVCVSWDDAMAYAKWVGCELPTEAQWEKAARGVKGLIYPWGDEWDEGKCRNFNNFGIAETAKVWGYPKGVGGYGTYQQSGNVAEWCRDWYGKDYYKEAGAGKNPTGPASGSKRVNRGGSWWGRRASCFRGADRRSGPGPSSDHRNLCFRLVSTGAEGKDTLSNSSHPVSRQNGTEPHRPGAASNPASAGPTLRPGHFFDCESANVTSGTGGVGS